MMKRTVRDIMTTEVVTVHASASFKEMAAKLHKHGVSAFPVLDDDGKVIGVVSEADMLPKEALTEEPVMITGILRHRDEEKAAAVRAADLMTHPAMTVAPGDSVEHAARLMYDRGVKRLPVTDEAGHLVGIISRADVLSVFDRPGEEIAKEILDRVIAGDFKLDPGRFTVTVKDGIVTIEGKPDDTSLGREIIARARRVQGVVSVRDRLSYPLPERRSAEPLT